MIQRVSRATYKIKVTVKSSSEGRYPTAAMSVLEHPMGVLKILQKIE